MLIVDGDPAKFNASRFKSDNERTILCLYHSTETIKKHCSRMYLALDTAEEGEL